MLDAMGFTKAEFLIMLADTRDSNAHLFTEEARLHKCIDNGPAMQFVLFLMQYCTRLALLEYCECIPSKVLSKEYFGMLHDWYAENVLCGKIPYISHTYTTVQILTQFRDKMIQE